jgi:phosphatidylserine decarboxylase
MTQVIFFDSGGKMIKYYNRRTKEYEAEKVAGEKYLNWIYSSPIGVNLLELFVKRKLFSKLYGRYCDTRHSVRNIDKFIKELDIDMSSCEKELHQFSSFNDFFIRKLSTNARPIEHDENILVSPGDGRLTAFTDIDMNKLVQVKGLTYSLNELIGDESVCNKFQGGICLILRLNPSDYHRFHFVDSGVCDETIKIKGHYYSVNPIALNKKEKLFCENKREWSLFHSDNFGDILHVEVGATCVGTIVQTYTPDKRVVKGAEKGYFKFGGSTTILFLQKDLVTIDEDILEQSNSGFETKVQMGERIGTKLTSNKL